MRFPRPARTTTLVVVGLLCGVLASDVAGLPGCHDGCKTATATAAAPVKPAPPKPPLLGVAPFNGAEDVNPLTKPVVDVVDGKITDVALYDDWGNAVEGKVSKDGTSWEPTQRLNFARNYTLTVNSKSSAGVPLSRTSTFSTLVPNNYIHPYIEVQGGFAPNPDVRYGVATIVIAHFDEAIADKQLAEKNMIVRTEPPLQGSWNWISDSVAHWRPENYYAPGTRINVDINTFGLKLGDGLYGQADAHATINIGASGCGDERTVYNFACPVPTSSVSALSSVFSTTGSTWDGSEPLSTCCAHIAVFACGLSVAILTVTSPLPSADSIFNVAKRNAEP